MHNGVPQPGTLLLDPKNVLDRAALVAIATKNTALYDAEMKDSIERLYQDVIECLHAQDQADKSMPTCETMTEAAS